MRTRISWYITIPLCLFVVGLTLWLGGRHYDFTTEPSPDALAEVAQEWRKKYPITPSRGDTLDADDGHSISDTSKQKQEDKAAPPLIQLPFGDLNISPALDHYIQHRNRNAAAMIYLAERLEDKEHPRYALLAWERVLDSTTPTPDQAQLASEAISRLRTTQPPWNADSSLNRSIVLHMLLPDQWKRPISGKLDSLTEEIRTASGFLLDPQVLIKTAPQSEGAPPPPVSIWLSGAEEGSKETPKLTFHIKSLDDDPEITAEEVAQQLFAALYRAISSELQRQDQLTPPIPLEHSPDAHTTLRTHLTRLHWFQLSKQLSEKF